jgi:hypothetical protein
VKSRIYIGKTGNSQAKISRHYHPANSLPQAGARSSIYEKTLVSKTVGRSRGHITTPCRYLCTAILLFCGMIWAGPIFMSYRALTRIFQLDAQFDIYGDIDRMLEIISRLKGVRVTCNSVDLRDCVESCFQFASGDPWDKIYAVLGLVSEFHAPPLYPDNKKSVEQVFTESAQHMLINDWSLEILHAAGIGLPRCPNFPS